MKKFSDFCFAVTLTAALITATFIVIVSLVPQKVPYSLTIMERARDIMLIFLVVAWYTERQEKKKTEG